MVPVGRAESLSVETAGRGDPVVLIPGLFGSAYGFRKVVPLLVDAGYRTIVIEPLGVGASARPEKANYSLTAQADRIAAVLDSLHVRHAIILAHSIGGSEAFRLAYRRPDLVRALLSIEGGPTEQAITPAFKRALRFAPWIKLFGGIRLIRRKIRGMLIDSSGDASWVTDSAVLGYTAAAARNLDATLKAYLAMANAREPELLAPRLPQIRCPVRLMVGGARHDGDVGAKEVQLLERSLPAFVLDSVAAAGHFIQEEEPGAVLAGVARLKASVTAGHSDGGSPDAHRVGRRGLLSAARGRPRARAQPRPAAQPLGAPDHRGHVLHGRAPGRRVRASGGDEPGDLFERWRVARDHRLAAAATPRGRVPKRPLRYRACARRARSNARVGGTVRRVARRHSGGGHVPLVVFPLGGLPRVPATAAADPRPSRGDDRGERAGGGCERALLPRRLGHHPERCGQHILPAERSPADRCCDRPAAAAVPRAHRAP